MSAPTRKELAAARITLAMRELEAAQNMLFTVAERLSPIIGGGPQQDRIIKLARGCKKEWYRLDEHRARLAEKGIDRDYVAKYDDEILRAVDAGVDLEPR